MAIELPLPPSIQLPSGVRLDDVEDAALELYQRVAETERRVEETERRLGAEISEKGRSAQRLIAMLAAERFEFDRLMRRLRPELERRDAGNVIQFLEMFARAWDLKLGRAAIEVVDLAGLPLSDDLVGDVEVESHLPDSSVTQTTVRETLIPLVLMDGKVIGAAKIVTSVPEATEENVQ